MGMVSQSLSRHHHWAPHILPYSDPIIIGVQGTTSNQSALTPSNRETPRGFRAEIAVTRK